jgi:hypothetical protein
MTVPQDPHTWYLLILVMDLQLLVIQKNTSESLFQQACGFLGDHEYSCLHRYLAMVMKQGILVTEEEVQDVDIMAIVEFITTAIVDVASAVEVASTVEVVPTMELMEVMVMSELVMILDLELEAMVKLVVIAQVGDTVHVVEGAGGAVAVLGCTHIHHQL